MSRVILKTAFIMLLIIATLPQIAQAQPGGDPGDPDVPIDGGLTLLIAAGVGYGVKKVRDERRKPPTPKGE